MTNCHRHPHSNGTRCKSVAIDLERKLGVGVRGSAPPQRGPPQPHVVVSVGSRTTAPPQIGTRVDMRRQRSKTQRLPEWKGLAHCEEPTSPVQSSVLTCKELVETNSGGQGYWDRGAQLLKTCTGRSKLVDPPGKHPPSTGRNLAAHPRASGGDLGSATRGSGTQKQQRNTDKLGPFRNPGAGV